MRIALGTLAFAIGSAAVAQVRTVEVPVAAETTVVATANDDAADDPAIWRNQRDPAQSLIVGTDKKAGLNVYGLDGTLRSSFPAGRVNNVDLRDVGGRVIVVASDRNDVANGKLALFQLDTARGDLKPLGVVAVGPGEAYGLCLGQPRAGTLDAFVVMKAGEILQVEIRLDGAPTAAVVRRMKLSTQSEGCVVDDRTAALYVGEERVGVWRFGARKTDSIDAVSIAKVDGQRLVADVEGIAIAAEGARGGYLVVSSQGDNAYAVWRLSDHRYVGRFRIAPRGEINGTQETDGIEVTTESFPGFRGGMFIAQDGNNLPAAQNFKLVRWADVKRALRLR